MDASELSKVGFGVLPKNMSPCGAGKPGIELSLIIRQPLFLLSHSNPKCLRHTSFIKCCITVY